MFFCGFRNCHHISTPPRPPKFNYDKQIEWIKGPSHFSSHEGSPQCYQSVPLALGGRHQRVRGVLQPRLLQLHHWRLCVLWRLQEQRWIRRIRNHWRLWLSIPEVHELFDIHFLRHSPQWNRREHHCGGSHASVYELSFLQ